ncbi:hypothetical protein [Patiriisocius hiemis]|uniref:Lipoprotein n=1 Tax=Patiriisocius hiemis TaxID=3075604 RepID=A0ABU2YAW8_9FLAO|nr:hypothetical protein [Constantimarinum sp. W242]MDT0555338.1 hypothetical protein [Constantimarinum sp. W242]
MKKLALLAILSVFVFGCKDNPVSKKIKETKNAVSNSKKAVDELNTMQEDIKELQQEEPLTNEEMKSWLPEEVLGMKRTAYKAGQVSYMKIANIEATYSNEDKSQSITVNVMDGAGEIGASATAGARMLLSMDMEEETETYTKRTVKKDNIKAMEEYQKKNNKTIIQLMYGKRFYVQVTGKGMNVEETWDAVDNLDLEDLG